MIAHRKYTQSQHEKTGHLNITETKMESPCLQYKQANKNMSLHLPSKGSN